MADASKIGDLLATGGDLLAQAYRRGYRDGVASAKARIVSSLSALDEVDHPAETSPHDSATPPKNGGVQSPHGTVRPIVLQILSEHPGSTVAETQNYAAQMNAKVSPLSIGGELRRLKGKFYHQRVRRWYLTEDGKREAAGIARQAAPTASHDSSQGEPHGTPLAASASE
jgi:hypothetical protein